MRNMLSNAPQGKPEPSQVWMQWLRIARENGAALGRVGRFRSVVLSVFVAGSVFVDLGFAGPGNAEVSITASSSSSALVSTGHVEQGFAKAATDSFWLYGGPGTDEGKFQSGSAPDAQGWTGVDLTDVPVIWQISDFNAETLHSNGPGNLAAWCGQTAEQQPNWISAPGYGPNWFEALTFEQVVADPSQGQTIDLDFYFHHDTMPDYDYFIVQYDSAGTWRSVYELPGSNKDGNGVFHAPGLRYSEQAGAMPIVYAGNDYGVENAIRVRLLVTSDGGWDGADGLWPSSGAAQVDDITLTCSEGTFFDDFENGWGNWWPDKPPFAGDFFSVFPRFSDIDPCVENATPMAGFLDYGQTVGNSASSAEIPGYPISTGGATSPNWDYGVPGGWVVTYEGGLSQGQVDLNNFMVSPEIEWDLPGTEDDGVDVAGAILRFDVWSHLPLLNALFYRWEVRAAAPELDWKDRNFVYFGGGTPHWSRFEHDVSDLFPPAPQKVQIRLGVLDLSNFFGFPGNDATPAPMFDNVSLQKYRIGGPVLSSRLRDLANDGFPVSGSIDASTQAARDALDIPFDMARDISSGPMILVGDSLVLDVTSIIPGADVDDIRMVWALDKNPLFEDAIRSVPSMVWDENVDVSDPLRWTGEMVAQQAYSIAGAEVVDRFFFDLPDVDFFYPGDVLRYYFRSTDTDGRITTLPRDTSGFLSGVAYDRHFTVRGLPSIASESGAQPTKLLIEDSGRGDGETTLLQAMAQLGFVEGVDFDTYAEQDAGRFNVSNGIGSAGGHGANAAQLAGYDTIVYGAGDLTEGLLSDGVNSNGNDKSDDFGMLTDWHSLSGARNVVYFGDNIGSGFQTAGVRGYAYVQEILSVSVERNDVAGDIGGQSAPVVLPLNPAFDLEFVAYGGCPDVNTFDGLSALPPAIRLHGFEVAGAPGTSVPIYGASVIHDRLEGPGDRKVDLTVPIGFQFIADRSDVVGSGASARSRFLGEIFDYLGVPSSGPAPTATPWNRKAEMSVHPNPFNPRTIVSLSLPKGGPTEVEIYDMRGRRVRILHHGELEAGPATWSWGGTDDSGATVASGVYVVRAKGVDFEIKKKAVLLK